MEKVNKVVLAYSGGLDTSVIIPWLKENYDCEVIAVCVDVGQKEELEGLEEKAIGSGASKCYIIDARQEFIEDYIYPTMMAGAVYEGQYLLGTSFARPIIAQKQVEVARKEKANAVAHGATGKGNDQVRFELTFKALAPDLKVIAPWRIWDITSREAAIDYASERGIPVPVSKAKPYSMDLNLWHCSYEGGVLEDPWNEPDEEMFRLTLDPVKSPNEPEYLEISFKQGRPVALDGREFDSVTLIERLNAAGGRHGVGRIDIVENRLVGMKSRGVYETPGGTILYAAHRALEELTLDKDTMHYKQLLAHRYAELVYNGQWFTPLREALDAFVRVTQETVTGTVRLMLFKGSVTVVGRQSPYSLYSEELATFGASSYDHKDAEGFINLFGLPIKTRAQLEAKRLAKED